MKRFFPESMEFYGFKEFFKRREAIKQQYAELEDYQQYVYRGYIYEMPFVTDFIRNAVWDYLNGFCPDLELVYIYSDYMRNKKKKDT